MTQREAEVSNSTGFNVTTTNPDGTNRALFLKYTRDRHVQIIPEVIAATNYPDRGLFEIAFLDRTTGTILLRRFDLTKICKFELKDPRDTSNPGY